MSKNATENQKKKARIRGLIYDYLDEEYSIRVGNDKAFKKLLKQLGYLIKPDEPVAESNPKPKSKSTKKYPEQILIQRQSYQSENQGTQTRVWRDGYD